MALSITNDRRYQNLYIEEEKTNNRTYWTICRFHLIYDKAFHWMPLELSEETGLTDDAIFDLTFKHGAICENSSAKIRFLSKARAQDFIDEIEAILLMEKLAGE